jgi:hypothetical protein
MLDCDPGKELMPDYNECYDCKPGMFSPEPGAACAYCPKGKFQAKSGSVMCEYCPSNIDSVGSNYCDGSEGDGMSDPDFNENEADKWAAGGNGDGGNGSAVHDPYSSCSGSKYGHDCYKMNGDMGQCTCESNEGPGGYMYMLKCVDSSNYKTPDAFECDDVEQDNTKLPPTGEPEGHNGDESDLSENDPHYENSNGDGGKAISGSCTSSEDCIEFCMQSTGKPHSICDGMFECKQHSSGNATCQIIHRVDGFGEGPHPNG